MRIDPSFGDLREKVVEIRSKMRWIQEREKSSWLGGDHPEIWTSYRLDARKYVAEPMTVFNVSFFGDFPDAEDLLKSFFELQRAQEKNVLVFDICGIADAAGLGADHTVCLTLSRPATGVVRTRTVFTGDITDPRSLDPLIDYAKKEYGIGPSCIFFVPVGGFGGVHVVRNVLGLLLLRQFERCLEMLEPGGWIYVQLPLEFTGIFLKPTLGALRNAVRGLGVLEHPDDESPLLRVRKNGG